MNRGKMHFVCLLGIFTCLPAKVQDLILPSADSPVKSKKYPSYDVCKIAKRYSSHQETKK